MQTPHDAVDLPAFERAALDELPAYLESALLSRRWFADKDRSVTGICIADWSSVSTDDGVLLLSIIDVEFETGPDATYAFPLFLQPGSRSSCETLYSFSFGQQQWTVADGVDAQLAASLISMIGSERSIQTRSGVIRSTCHAPLTANQLAERAIPSNAEQSNSSLLYETMIAKVYRKLMPGENPDVEIGRVLAQSERFAAMPRLIGSLEYTSPRAHYTLAMLQARIPSPQDGWSYLLDTLVAGDETAYTVGSAIGELTARMHIALSSVEFEPAFQPEASTEATIRGWRETTSSSASQVVASLKSQSACVSGEVADLAAEVTEKSAMLDQLCSGFERLTGYPLVRVHGDYHLGQVLRDERGTWWVVDFEGEPRRSIEERIQKTSPLKDVAGMLRSFSYAGGVARQEGVDAQTAATWEQRTRAEFLQTYLSVIRNENPHLLPADDASLFVALRAWELDKALYEVLYELSSRPDWLWLPLGAVAAMTSDSAS